MKSFSSLTAAALFSLAMPGAQACALALSGGPPSVTIEYNPFEPGTARALVSLQLKNSGNKACDGALAFFHGGRPVAKGLGSDGVAFGVKNYLTGGDLLGQDAVPPVLVRNPFLPATNLTPGETRSVNVVVTVAPGQIVHPGLFSDSVDIVTYQGLGTSMTRTANQVPMSVQVSVETVMSVNIAGGGQSATLDFGVLAAGAARSAMIQARSNQGFRFAASSENGGVMKLEPPAGDGIAWQVPYTIKINDGSDLTLRTNQTVSFAKGATSIAGTNVPVEVKTGDPLNQRAGRYKDVIVSRSKRCRNLAHGCGVVQRMVDTAGLFFLRTINSVSENAEFDGNRPRASFNVVPERRLQASRAGRYLEPFLLITKASPQRGR